MRKIIKLMTGWNFTDQKGNRAEVTLPHTWNNKDGQDGGNDYWRGTLTYDSQFAMPAFDAKKNVFIFNSME